MSFPVDDSVFFDTDAWGVAATLPGHSNRSINCTLDTPYDGQGAIASRKIILTARTADIFDVLPGEQVITGGVTYYVISAVEDTGIGFSIAQLSKDVGP